VATVVHRGNRSAVVTVDVLDMGTDTLCAVATAAFSVAPAPVDPVP
jgi:acyl-coenzyme A thioesterase PaaI-like protein